MRRAIIAATMLSCATPGAWTRGGIARNLDASLQAPRPVGVLYCDPVYWARDTCIAAGMEPSCAWDGWHDADHDSFTIAACLERKP